MIVNLRLKIIFISIVILFTKITVVAEEEEIYLQAISDQIQVITKDLKTLEKAVYQKSDIVSSTTSTSLGSDSLNEDIMTKHLLKIKRNRRSVQTINE